MLAALVIALSIFLPDPDNEFGPSFMIPFMLVLVLCVGVLTLGFTSIVAFIWYLIRQAWRSHLVGKRSG
jgi:hypothetical protein